MKIMLLPIIVFLWVTTGIVVAFWMPAAMNLRATPAAFFHVPMAMAMELAFVMAAWHGVQWLRGRGSDETSNWRRVQHDLRSLAFAEIGFACGLIAIASGAIWAKINWNSYWSWDPQQVGIVATLLTYAALFAVRGATDDETRRRNNWAVYAILGVIAAIFWTFVFRHLTAFSLHPSQTVTGSDPQFKWALRFNIIGYALLMFWIVRLRVRLLFVEELAARRRFETEEIASSETTSSAKEPTWA